MTPTGSVIGRVLTISSLIVLAQCQYNYGAIASCSDFNCTAHGTNNCTVQGEQYFSAGMVPFETPFNSNLTWTVAVRGYDSNTSNIYMHIVKDYYLGAPPNVDLQTDNDGFSGCAAFFVDSNASFPLRQPPGNCASVIGGECAQALQSQAADGARGSVDSAQDLCSRLNEAFMSPVPSACSAMALNGTSWGRIRFRPITGTKAPSPPTPAQNSSTNCNPVIPASNDLSLALSFDIYSKNDSLWNSTYRGTIYDQSADAPSIEDFIYHQAVPILSVFAPHGDGGSEMSSVQTDVICLSPNIDGLLTLTQVESAAWRNAPSSAGGWAGLGLSIAAGIHLWL